MDNSTDKLPSENSDLLLNEISQQYAAKLDALATDPQEKTLYYTVITNNIEAMHALHVDKGVSRHRLYEQLNDVISAMQRSEEAQFRAKNGVGEAESLRGNKHWENRKRVTTAFLIEQSESTFNKYFIAACNAKGLDPKRKTRKKQRQNEA